MVIHLLLFLCMLDQCLSGNDEAVTTMNLDENNFNSLVTSSPHFVMFFAPWCGHCKKLAPIWDMLAAKHNKDRDTEVMIAKVDCTVATSLCSAQGITGYPTLKFFKSGVEYNGDRDAASFDKFIVDQLGNKDPEERTEGPESAEPVEENGLLILSSSSFSGVVSKGDTFVKFYAPWCGHCLNLAPSWAKLATELKSEKDVKIAKVDCTQDRALCQEYGVQGYPSLYYFRNGHKIEKYGGPRSLKDLKSFVNTQTAKDDTEGGKTIESNTESSVAILDNENFENDIKSRVAFIKFFAPWCGYCKKLAPTWEDLAKKYQDTAGVVIGRVDCTSDSKTCNTQGVGAYPTLLILKDGVKIEEYSGGRDLQTLTDFVEKHLAAEPINNEL